MDLSTATNSFVIDFEMSYLLTCWYQTNKSLIITKHLEYFVTTICHINCSIVQLNVIWMIAQYL